MLGLEVHVMLKRNLDILFPWVLHGIINLVIMLTESGSWKLNRVIVVKMIRHT